MQRLAALRAAAERVARSYGLEIFDDALRRESIGMVLASSSTGLIAAWSKRRKRSASRTASVSAGSERAVLDVEDDDLDETALSQHYTLEVSSPGLDRPLRHEADYRRFAGRLAKIVTAAPLDGQSAFSGRIVGVERGAVVLAEGRKTHRVPLGHIKRGHLAVEF